MDNSKTIGISVAVFVACSTINAVMSQKPKETSTVVKPHGAPQPKWVVLQTLNYVVLAVFVGSITYAGLNYRRLSAEQNGAGGVMSNLLFLFSSFGRLAWLTSLVFLGLVWWIQTLLGPHRVVLG